VSPPSTFRNWAGDQACVPTSIVMPASVDEVVDVVTHAADGGETVKVVGSGHSFTAAALTAGTMIRLDALDRLVEADPASGMVRVEAGIPLHRLNTVLHRLGLALPNLGDIDRQTIAGAIATATHGTGAARFNISAQVVAAQVVTADGQIREVEDGDDLLATRVHLGALGAVTAVTLQCVPAFVLHRIDTPVPLDRVLADFDELADTNDHFEFFVFPGGDTALTIRRNHTDQPPAPRNRIAEFVAEDLVQNRLGNRLLQLTGAIPRLYPTASKVASRFLSEGEYIDHSHRVFASHRDIRFTEMEYAVPRAAGPAMVERVLAWLHDSRFPVAMPIEVRVVAGDDALLSPSHQRDSVYIAVHQYRGLPWQPYFQAVEAIAAEFGGRPHWGKRHHLDAATLRERYPRFDDFLAVRDRFDPNRVFANAYTRQVLGD